MAETDDGPIISSEMDSLAEATKQSALEDAVPYEDFWGFLEDVQWMDEPVPTARPFRFLDLPKDVRLCVYEKLPTTTRHIPLPMTRRETRQTAMFVCVVKTMPLAILASCRLVNEEASAILKGRLNQLCSRIPQMTVNYAMICRNVGIAATLNESFDFRERLWHTLKCARFLLSKALSEPENKRYVKCYGTDSTTQTRFEFYTGYDRIRWIGDRLLWKFVAHIERRNALHTGESDDCLIHIAVEGLEYNWTCLARNHCADLDGSDEAYLEHLFVDPITRAFTSVDRRNMIKCIPKYDEFEDTETQLRRIPRSVVDDFCRRVIETGLPQYPLGSWRDMKFTPVMSHETWRNEWKEGVQYN
ncbi:hypothetical protein DM02DRAFT_670082 [Periconia macrospinosa]|uniref:Uncharacterized protein n=1 Tax=Periconia macrospinosa TaxID=97972 RepID=A0A2V1DY72_9PLEO|nr:hypothetical protein DM02DRAFT_670082 [Periconia macrospinosa]